MSGFRCTALAALTATSLSTSLCLAGAASAGDTATWNGDYILTLSANAKTGTSIAASQPEPAKQISVSMSSTCATGVCIATVNNPAPPKNDSMPKSIEFVWNGAQWVRQMEWKWDCLLPDGTVEYDPAKSTSVYTPGQNGTFTGLFHTDIFSGACQGSVEMPLSAKPAPSAASRIPVN
ncbi:hypothetical protein [Mycobacterium angelicum]|uniref:Secreted protein n=1 Tax=Mycobacterium angelicum TaxID=470074 RepID=A0A1W9ZUA6_MYCAN|nr:hypothetical protein [Mycobacterium angelicum]MCV7195895.1 hypothetical protein [Mycobacterium angelicum]ORA21341.1 hypothetical protein BST12_13190 [Mycobacterium angelicum]